MLVGGGKRVGSIDTLLAELSRQTARVEHVDERLWTLLEFDEFDDESNEFGEFDESAFASNGNTSMSGDVGRVVAELGMGCCRGVADGLHRCLCDSLTPRSAPSGSSSSESLRLAM